MGIQKTLLFTRCSGYKLPVDVLANGGVILYLMNQEWPVPLDDKVVKHRFKKNVK